jgi:hypothetical protein
MNNINISFPSKYLCTNILNEFINNDINNKKLYFNTSDYFINIKNKKYSDLYNFLTKSINLSTNILNIQMSFFILKLFSSLNNHWNICIFDNIMFNLPFTLSNIIFIPLQYLISSCKNNNFNTFSNTLIHEKIHIFQRTNLNKWLYIIKLSFQNWIIIKKNTNIYNYLINYDFSKHNINRIFNPDVTYNFLYLYNINDKYYYGFFHTNKHSNNINITWFLLENKNNKLSLNQVYDKNLPKEEHPFEMFAYKFADYLINKNSTNSNFQIL